MKNLNTEIYEEKWNESYSRAENYLIYPNEEVIRFASRNLCKILPNEKSFYENFNSTSKILDYGCGAGRHMAFLDQLGFTPFGVDISETALELALTNLLPKYKNNLHKLNNYLLPFEDAFFDAFIACSVLDSMHFDLSKKVLLELNRVMKKGAVGHIDLISNIDTNIDEGFVGDTLVQDQHEFGTIQSYFHEKLIKELIGDNFVIREICHVKHSYLKNKKNHARFYIEVIKE